MSGLAIVAIPTEDDYVWKISSEKVPHMTLLFLGDVSDQSKIINMTNFLQHAAETSLCRFYMSVDKRGVLGPDEADVVFFKKRGWTKRVEDFRASLLQNEAIFEAYNSTTQYDQWTPHLTLGYPATPAHEDEREYPGLDGIRFDRIAIWTGDYEGATFELKDQYDEYADACWSDKAREGEAIISHHGIRGMKWGVRRSQRQLSGASPDHLRAHEARAKVKKHKGTHVLTNQELKDLTTRMNLEQQFSNLSHNPKNRSVTSKGAKIAGEIVGNVGKQQATRVLNDQVTKQISKKFKI